MPELAHVFRVEAVNGLTLLRLKSWLPEHRSGEKPVSLGGEELPSQAGVTVSSDSMRVLCMGPGEWLLVLRERLSSDPVQHGLALVDLSDGLCVLQVEGSAAREVLSKGCGLDLHPHHFPGGNCARTRFAQIPLVIESIEDSLRFRLYVARSHVSYLQAWLADAALEFQD